MSVIQYKCKIIYLQVSVGYKTKKKTIQFSKHYLVSYDQKYSKSHFSVIRRNTYVGIKLTWKEPPPPPLPSLHPPSPCNHVRQKSAGFVYFKGVSQVIQLFRNCIKLAINLLNEVNVCNTVLQFQTELSFGGEFEKKAITFVKYKKHDPA